MRSSLGGILNGPLAGLFLLDYAALGISSNLLVVSISILAAATILFRVRAGAIWRD